ncbi:MAG TPA: Ig-like domain-containing protein [Vicinamibacteria bacterium]|jgi:hypothetical protein
MIGSLAVLLAASAVSAVPPDNDWLDARDGVVQLALAAPQRSGPCGGVLTVDANRRMLLWEGISGDLGCRDKVEAGFDDVKAVSVGSEAGFVVSFRRDAGRKLTLLPRPHAHWFERQFRTSESGLQPGVVERLGVAGGRGGETTGLGLGGAAALPSTAPQVKRRELPHDVQDDTRRAVTAVLEALGRAPAPSALLREALYGMPVEVLLGELAESPVDFEGRAVRVTGRLSWREEAPLLHDGGFELGLVPTPEIRDVSREEMRAWPGQEVEATGVLKRVTGDDGLPRYLVQYWEYAGPTSDRPIVVSAAPATTLSALFAGTPPVGRSVTVIGQFRGGNLHGDLPNATRSKSRDWVIKQEDHAVWVTGKAPRGRGFSLGLDDVAHTVNWLEVTGRLQKRDGVYTLRASRVGLARPPASEAAHVAPARRIRGRENMPPSVVFALPLEGDEAVSRNSRFIVQFSKYMDEASFKGRVRLRYAAPREGDPAFDTLRLAYDNTRRALVVDPGLPLEPGRRVECLLLPGIVDADGIPLQPRNGKTASDFVEVLRYQVEGTEPGTRGLDPGRRRGAGM